MILESSVTGNLKGWEELTCYDYNIVLVISHQFKRGGEALPVMAFMERLFLKGVLISGFSYIQE